MAQQPEAKESPPPGVDKFYFDLTRSEDRSTRNFAERYINLVKSQEWSDLTGKYTVVAHYVRHDPNLTTVTIGIMKGHGDQRTAEEKTVPVDKLSKTCQSRVRQIDTLQKRLQEMVSKTGATGAPGAAPGNPGSPMMDERGAEPGAGPPLPAAEAPDPSASDPDPLGFAEIQFEAVPPPGSIPPAGPEAGPGPAGLAPPGVAPPPGR